MKTFRFESEKLPGAVMNRYGIVSMSGHEVSPAMRGLVVREAMQAGCRLVPSGEPDVGNVWVWFRGASTD